MYNYNIAYSSHEECPSVILSNQSFFTEEEFNELLSDVYVHCYKDKVKEYKAKNRKIEYINISTLYKDVINYLIKNHGFNRLDIVHKFEPFGWQNLTDNIGDIENIIGSWSNDINEFNKLITDKLKD